MEVFDAIKERKSVRKFEAKKIPSGHLKKLLDSARLAPSGHNLQPWQFIAVEEQKTKNELVKACNNQKFISDAGVIIAGVTDLNLSRYVVIDTAIALEHIVLEATELGYGSCWIGSFREEEVKKVLKIPSQLKVVCLLAIGFPAEKPKGRERKKLNEIAYSNFFGEELKLK